MGVGMVGRPKDWPSGRGEHEAVGVSVRLGEERGVLRMESLMSAWLEEREQGAGQWIWCIILKKVRMV